MVVRYNIHNSSIYVDIKSVVLTFYLEVKNIILNCFEIRFILPFSKLPYKFYIYKIYLIQLYDSNYLFFCVYSFQCVQIAGTRCLSASSTAQRTMPMAKITACPILNSTKIYAGVNSRNDNHHHHHHTCCN